MAGKVAGAPASSTGLLASAAIGLAGQNPPRGDLGDFGEAAKGLPDNLSPERSRQEMAIAFQPVLRSFLRPIAAFCIAVILPDFLWSPFAIACLMSVQACGTALVALFCRHLLGRRQAALSSSN